VSGGERQRVQRIKEYVLARLREELACAPRGAQAQLAKKLGVSGAHLSNMLSRSPTRQPGEDFRRKVAAHWGMSYGQLEAISLGEEAPPSTAQAISWRAEAGPPNLTAVITQYAWMPELPNHLRSVVREQARQYLRFGGFDYSPHEWQRIVTGLEREALALLARRVRTDSAVVPREERKRTVKIRK
jgi:transcriptional regulator with XRE-family HTH domain